MIFNPLIFEDGAKWMVSYASSVTTNSLTFPVTELVNNSKYFIFMEDGRSITSLNRLVGVIGGTGATGIIKNSGTTVVDAVTTLYNATWSTFTVTLNSSSDGQFDTTNNHILIYASYYS